MTELTKSTSARTCNRNALSTIQIGQKTNSTPSTDYSTIVTNFVVVHIPYNYFNPLQITGMIHCLTSLEWRVEIVESTFLKQLVNFKDPLSENVKIDKPKNLSNNIQVDRHTDIAREKSGT